MTFLHMRVSVKIILGVSIAAVLAGAVFVIMRDVSRTAPDETTAGTGLTRVATTAPDALPSAGDIKGAPQTTEALAALRQRMPDLSRPVNIRTPLLPEIARETEDEIHALEKSLTAECNYLPGWLQLASLRKLIGDNEGAREVWEFATILRPESYVAFHNLGELYGFTLNNYPKAEENFLTSIALEPKNLDAYKSLATLYQHRYKEKQTQTSDILLRGIEEFPKESSLLVMLARYYAASNNLAEARKYYEKAIALEPENTGLKKELNTL
jgi:tetratricopeptide (TPR) repeat protein